MMPVVILLQSMEQTPLMFASVDEMEGVVRNIVDDVAHQEERPDCCVDDGVFEHQYPLHKPFDGQIVYDEEEGNRQHQSISE